MPGAANGGGEGRLSCSFEILGLLWGSLLEKDFEEVEKCFHCMI